MYINGSLKYKMLEKSSNEFYQALWIEIQSPKNADIIMWCYLQATQLTETFLKLFPRNY